MNEAISEVTKEEELKPRDNDNGLWISLAIHFFIFSLIILQNVFWSQERIDFDSAIRVDIVGLPDKLPTEKPNQTPSDEPQLEKKIEEKSPEPENNPPAEATEIKNKLPEKQPPKDVEAIKLLKEKPDAKNSDKLKKKQTEAIEKIKKLSAIDKIKSELAHDLEKKSSNANNNKNSFQYKGNVINPGTELTGLNKIQHENYVSEIDRKIKENWTLPQWLTNKDLKAQALIKIDESGVVVYNQIYKSSGHAAYDDIVLDTITRSSPFPKPPEKFLAIVGVKGILIGFPE